MFSCEKPEMFPLKLEIRLGFICQYHKQWACNLNTGLLCLLGMATSKNNPVDILIYSSNDIMVWKVDFKPVSYIFGNTNYKYLDLHIYPLLTFWCA